MKTTFIFLVGIFVSFGSQAQDTIRKTDGTFILGLVKEIDSETIVFTRFDQAEGPIRKIAISTVSEIIYKDGTKEIFTNTGTPGKEATVVKNDKPSVGEPGTINTSNETIIIRRRGPDIRVRPGERIPGGSFPTDHLFNNGFYLDAMIGYAMTSKSSDFIYDYTLSYYVPTYSQFSNVTFGVRFGSKFYFGTNEKYRLGLNVAWVHLTGMLNDSNRGDVLLAPVNFGLASAFKLGEHTGIEVNTTTGLAISTIYSDGLGIKYGVDVKYRYDSFAVGIDLARTNTVFGKPLEFGNLIGVSVGLKF